MNSSAQAEPDPVPSAPVTVTKPAKALPPVEQDNDGALDACPASSYTGGVRSTSLAGLCLVVAATLFIRRRHTAQTI